MNEFKLEIESYLPESSRHVEYWREVKKRCIEGYWVSGKWMPGKLYFYINLGIIKLNKPNSKVKHYGRPWLRDLEWEFFYNWEEARGFSGFTEDPNFTCLREVKEYKDALTTEDEQMTDFLLKQLKTVYPSTFHNNKLKAYIPAKEYLRKTHPHNYGRPLYENQSKNLCMLGSRGFGKSYSVSVGIIAHEYLFDGKTIYNPESETTAAEIVVGAGDAKYSGDLLDKVKTSIEHLPGEFEYNGVTYPSPLYKTYNGSWQSGKQITATYKKKVGGQWKWAGSKSNIKHRTFKDNPFAANGTRPGVMAFEEIGFFDNLIESYKASVECQRDGAVKFGSMMFLGTGGDLGSGRTQDAQEIFYNPQLYDCVEFEDVWEQQGKIGYFVPASLGLNQYKDENGITNVELATAYLEKTRTKLRLAKGSSSALEGELINRPLVPSEAFMQKQGAYFPVVELRNRLASIQNEFHRFEKPVELFFDPDSLYNGVSYKIDIKKKLKPINNFPWKDSDREGAVVIYEFPQLIANQVPQGAYVIGYDPYASDDPSGTSLGSIVVMKTKKYFSKIGHDEIIATYCGRPFEGRHIINETLYKLSKFYGDAKIYFENVRGNTKEYFEKIKRLDLLAKTPQTVLSKKASHDIRQSASYGYPMSSQGMKIEGIQYVRDWLLEERESSEGQTIRNLDRIWDRALLQELIQFNLKMNADRVMSLIGCVIGMEETHNKYKEEAQISNLPSEIEQILTNNKFLFKNAQSFSPAAPINVGQNW